MGHFWNDEQIYGIVNKHFVTTCMAWLMCLHYSSSSGSGSDNKAFVLQLQASHCVLPVTGVVICYIQERAETGDVSCVCSAGCSVSKQ